VSAVGIRFEGRGGGVVTEPAAVSPSDAVCSVRLVGLSRVRLLVVSVVFLDPNEVGLDVLNEGPPARPP